MSGVGSILAALGLLCSALSEEKFDASKLLGVFAGVSAGVGLISARDNKVTSEDAGARK